MVYSYARILLSNKKRMNADIHNNMNKSQDKYTEWEKPDMKVYVMHDSIHIEPLKIQTNP